MTGINSMCEFLTEPSFVFASCADTVDPVSYMELCKMDMCSCRMSNFSVEECMGLICDSAQQYARMCARRGIQFEWRSENFCRE